MGKCPLVFPLVSFYCSASALWFTEVPESSMLASCRLRLQLQHQALVVDSSAKIKGCRQTEQSSNIRGKTSGYFLINIWCDFTKIAVLYNVLTRIVKFCFSKQWVAVKVTSCCFKFSLVHSYSSIYQKYSHQLKHPQSFTRQWIYISDTNTGCYEETLCW